jgi:hypothetical protein
MAPIKGFERRCFSPYLKDDEEAGFKKDRDGFREIPDWRKIPDWCPLSDTILPPVKEDVIAEDLEI